MGRVRGFRCEQCRTEVLAAPAPGQRDFREDWVPPITCCGQLLKRLSADWVAGVGQPRCRVARCPRCGYEVRLILRPVHALICTVCDTECVVAERHLDQPRPDTPPRDRAPPHRP